MVGNYFGQFLVLAAIVLIGYFIFSSDDESNERNKDDGDVV